MTYQLICEGACNPTIKQVDEEVALGLPLTDETIIAQRKLQHTPHEMNGPYHATCLHCGAWRRYGNEMALILPPVAAPRTPWLRQESGPARTSWGRQAT